MEKEWRRGRMETTVSLRDELGDRRRNGRHPSPHCPPQVYWVLRDPIMITPPGSL
jgi:hypothetical protein